jgi:Amt family ammonium transporter
MGRELAQTRDSAELSNIVARHITIAVGWDECGLYYWDRANNAVVTYGYYPPTGRGGLDNVYPLADFPETRAVLVGRRRSVTDPTDASADPNEVRFLTALGGSLMVQVPMVVNGEAIGTIEIMSRSDASLGQRQLDLVQTMANEAGVMLENTRLYEQLRHEALHDPLTGLPNRTLFGDRLFHALARGRAPARPLVALLYLDVNDFKSINDRWGHDTGDLVLQDVARRLLALSRVGDTVARLSGDEFGLLLEDLSEPDAAIAAAERIEQVFSTPIRAGERNIEVSLSIGIDVATGDTRNPEDLLRNADFAMYRAKQTGASHRTYVAVEREAADEHIDLATGLRTAVERGELVLHYQPIVDLRSGRIRAFEALIRWQHPERGLLPPMTFVPIAEATGTIVEIGAWALNRACEDLQVWQASHADLAVSVNVSTRQLESTVFVDQVKQVLHRTGVRPDALILEVTETALLGDAGAAVLLERLKALGVRIAIDDFGTGYASISYLRKFPVDILKIDREFVQGAQTSDGAALLRGIIALGRAVGLKLVAEGVERDEDAELIGGTGCDEGQGFLYARPMVSDDVAALLSSRRMFRRRVPAPLAAS